MGGDVIRGMFEESAAADRDLLVNHQLHMIPGKLQLYAVNSERTLAGHGKGMGRVQTQNVGREGSAVGRGFSFLCEYVGQRQPVTVLQRGGQLGLAALCLHG